MIPLMVPAAIQQAALALSALSHFDLPAQMMLAREYPRLVAGGAELPVIEAALAALPMGGRTELERRAREAHQELTRIVRADQNFVSGSLVQLIGGSSSLGLGLIYPRNARMHLVLPDGDETAPAVLNLLASARFLYLPQEGQAARKIPGYALIGELMTASHQDFVSEEGVKSYTEAILSGKKMKAIGVNPSTEDSEMLVAANGHHRAVAASRLGYRYILANLVIFPSLRPGRFLVRDLPIKPPLL